MLPESSPATLELRCCAWASRAAAWRPLAGLMILVSRLGDGVIWYLLMLVLACLGGPHGVRAAAHMLLTSGAALLLYRCLKLRTRRPRPYQASQAVTLRTAALDEYSFPSGHTLHAVTYSLLACSYFPLLAWPLAVLTALIALSRVLLGLHYPSDVIASLLLGFLLAEVSLLLAS